MEEFATLDRFEGILFDLRTSSHGWKPSRMIYLCLADLGKEAIGSTNQFGNNWIG